MILGIGLVSTNYEVSYIKRYTNTMTFWLLLQSYLRTFIGCFVIISQILGSRVKFVVFCLGLQTQLWTFMEGLTTSLKTHLLQCLQVQVEHAPIFSFWSISWVLRCTSIGFSGLVNVIKSVHISNFFQHNKMIVGHVLLTLVESS